VRTLLPLVALLAALPASRARAVEPVVALRLGVGAALGSAVRDVPMSDVVPVQYPLQLDVLARQGPVAGGAYASYALASAGRCGGASCSARAARVGLQGTWTFTTAGASEPWLGVASGYEWITEERRQGGTITSGYRGFEPLAVQGGVEWRVAPWLALGPYALLSVGRYARYTLDTGLEQASVGIPHPALHAWIHLGVRGRLVLGAPR
jgi:outer membrane protein